MNDIKKSEMLRWKALFPFLMFEYFHKDFYVEDIGDIRPTGTGRWITPDLEYNTFANLLIDINDGCTVRFIPDQPWPYPPETREGVPVWANIVYSDEVGVTEKWMRFSSIEHLNDIFDQEVVIEVVAADPRNLQEPPK